MPPDRFMGDIRHDHARERTITFLSSSGPMHLRMMYVPAGCFPLAARQASLSDSK